MKKKQVIAVSCAIMLGGDECRCGTFGACSGGRKYENARWR